MRTGLRHVITGIFWFKLSLSPPSYWGGSVRASQMEQAPHSCDLHGQRREPISLGGTRKEGVLMNTHGAKSMK